MNDEIETGVVIGEAKAEAEQAAEVAEEAETTAENAVTIAESASDIAGRAMEEAVSAQQLALTVVPPHEHPEYITRQEFDERLAALTPVASEPVSEPDVVEIEPVSEPQVAPEPTKEEPRRRMKFGRSRRS